MKHLLSSVIASVIADVFVPNSSQKPDTVTESTQSTQTSQSTTQMEQTQQQGQLQNIVAPLFRYALISAGSSLVTRGYINKNQLNTIAGGIVTLATTQWMLRTKRKQSK